MKKKKTLQLKPISICHELGLLLCLSLSHSVVHTHTHAYRQTHTPTLSPTCLSSQSALALPCSDTCSHSHLIILSIYSGSACSSLSDYWMSWMWSPTCRILKRSYLVLSRLELLWVSDFLGVLLLPPVSPVPRGPLRQKSPGPDLLHFCFVFFPVLCLRTSDCLVLLLH